ncbi:MAG TPA: glycosyltransferase [Rhodanobacteraceae bacterium]
MIIDASKVVGLVLHFRTARSTLTCLHSLFDEGIRVCVLVDNSEDGGASVADMHAELEAWHTAGMNVDVLVCDRNLGFAKGVNVGLARAVQYDAKAVLLINSDAEIERGSLASLIRGLDRARILVPRRRSRRDAPAVGLFGFYQAATAILARKQRLGFSQYPSGCCLLLRADLTHQPLFDDDFFFYGEDVMLARTLQMRGVPVVECADAVVIHAGSESAKNGSMFYEYHINRGHWLLGKKLASNSFQRVAYIVCRCVTLPLRALVRSLRFRSLTPFRGLIAATVDVMKARCRNFTPPTR